MVRGLRRGEQRLGGHAPGPQAVAPDPVPLDGGHPQPDRRGELGGDEASGAHPDHHEVVAHQALSSSAVANAMEKAVGSGRWVQLSSENDAHQLVREVRRERGAADRAAPPESEE